MKKLFLLLAAVLLTVGTWAQTDVQDIIYTTRSERIEAKILEISSSDVRYKDWENLNGPTYVLSVLEITKIEFSNGTVKTFTKPAAAPQATQTTQPAPQSAQPAQTAKPKEKLPMGFQFNIDVEGNLSFINGYTVRSGAESYNIKNFACGGADIALSAGVRIAEWMFAGVAAGFLGEWADPKIENKGQEEKGHFSAYTVPIYADVRAYAPTHGNCFPYIEVGIGGYLDDLCGSIKYQDASFKNPAKGGFYLISGVGLEFKSLNIGAGYKLMRNADYIGNHGYVKVGVSLGRPQKLRAAK